MSKFFEEQERLEREADAPRWEAFWKRYKPLQRPEPPRRPSPAEIERYLEQHPEAIRRANA